MQRIMCGCDSVGALPGCRGDAEGVFKQDVRHVFSSVFGGFPSVGHLFTHAIGQISR